MNKEEWVQEAYSQIMEFESNIKYLQKCNPNEYEQNTIFKVYEMIKNLEKQIKFLKDGIKLIQEENA